MAAFQSVLDAFEYSSSTLTGTRYSSSAPATRALRETAPCRSRWTRWSVIGPSLTSRAYHLSSSNGSVLSTEVCVAAGRASTAIPRTATTNDRVGVMTGCYHPLLCVAPGETRRDPCLRHGLR